MYEIEYSNSFKKDYKRIQKRGYDLSLFASVLGQLMECGTVEVIYRPHKLIGNYTGCWECHIQPDWLLVWEVDDILKVVRLISTGTHSDLF